MFSPTPSREHERHGDTHPMTAPKFRPLTFGVTRVVVRDGAPGVRYLKAEQALKEHPARLTDRLKHWADTAPERTFMARRVKRADGSSGDWRHVTYGEAWASARAIAQGAGEEFIEACVAGGIGVDRLAHVDVVAANKPADEMGGQRAGLGAGEFACQRGKQLFRQNILWQYGEAIRHGFYSLR